MRKRSWSDTTGASVAGDTVAEHNNYTRSCNTCRPWKQRLIYFLLFLLEKRKIFSICPQRAIETRCKNREDAEHNLGNDDKKKKRKKDTWVNEIEEGREDNCYSGAGVIA